MCLNPTLIPNPNFKSKTGKLFKKDTSSQFIPIPCGHCSECMATRSFGIIQRCQLEEMTGHPFMVFLSYSNEMIPRITTSDGAVIKYADFKDVTNMFKRLRSTNAIGRRFRYLVVSERGEGRGRPHFHMLLFVEKKLNDNSYDILNLESHLNKVLLSEWRRNVAKSVNKKGEIVPNTRQPEYKALCRFVQYRINGKLFGTFGCHYVSPTSQDGSTVGASYYVTKYFLKRDEASQKLQQALRLNLPSYEYEKVWNTVRTRCISSLNFGFGLYSKYNPRTVKKDERYQLLSSLPTFRHLADSLSRSISSNQESPKFYNVFDGSPLPLSRYFYHIPNLYTYEVYSYFKDLSNLYGDFVQIDDRSQFYKDQLEDTNSKRLSLAFKHTDLTDLID